MCQCHWRHRIKAWVWTYNQSSSPDVFVCVTVQSELERVEEEQTFQELQSLRQIVYDWFQKEEEIAEVTLKSSTVKPAECLWAAIFPPPWQQLADHWVSTGDCVMLFVLQNVREPNTEPPASSPSPSIPKSGSTGMIQYLHSWFPGWGGWYGVAQGADGPPEELLASPSSWNILGKKLPRGVV